MENPEIAQIFDEVADLLEIQGANTFRVRAYRNAARVVRDHPEPLADLGQDPSRFENLPGIGKDLAGKIRTIVETGDLPLRNELHAQVPPGLRELLNISGLGPKRAQILHRELGIRTIEDLRQAVVAQRVREIKGFGAKTEEAILRALEKPDQAAQRVYLADAKVFADAVVRHLKGAPGVEQAIVAGSLRRRLETVG